MSERQDRLNGSQGRLADTLEGMVVVDAGPGTGKTHTIVRRYENIISRPDVSPGEVILLTFTNNAAAEMEERIKSLLNSKNRLKESKQVQATTFDSFCLSIVLDSPDQVGDFFGMKERLTPNARITTNKTQKNMYFCDFIDGFLKMNEGAYGPWEPIASEKPLEVMFLIEKLMSKGIMAIRGGWFGLDVERTLYGDRDGLLRILKDQDVPGDGKRSKLADTLSKLDVNKFGDVPLTFERQLGDAILGEVVDDTDRELMVQFIHDVYYEYVRKSISDNRLTFQLNSMLAFTVLYSNRSVRERNRFRYVMIDEFQDTNSNQLMIALMLLSEPNLCVVGDWKQGIYGFRYVSIENITDFRNQCVRLRRFLNEDLERVPFTIPDVTLLSLDTNYRSHQFIIDRAFDCLFLKGSKEDVVPEDSINESLVRISQGRDDLEDADSSIRYVQAKDIQDEVKMTVDAILDYVSPGRYECVDKGQRRPMGYSDIAVFCRNIKHCRLVLKACLDHGIPAFMSGDECIMSTREGKLALAWLRYVNNEMDPWGLVPVMADMGYNLVDINDALSGPGHVPEIIREQRRNLYNKRRRITDLMTSLYGFYNLDNDVTQAIISTVSDLHRNSLMTISDIITIVENDIEEETSYPMENSISGNAVSIMTMHKSKGLEYPAVIMPFIDQMVMPSTKSDSSMFSVNDLTGIRCRNMVSGTGQYDKICQSWKTHIAMKAVPHEYDEERRLMFVSMSRAKQFETLIASKPSIFIEGLNLVPEEIPASDFLEGSVSDQIIPMPEIGEYTTRRVKMAVHDIMDFGTEDGMGGMSDDSDEVCGKGKEYGSRIHELAHLMNMGARVDETEFPELPVIRKVLDDLSDADLLRSEIECALPVEGTSVTLRGVIDLLAVYDDHVEIHDWKTDVSDRFIGEYMIQLSVYAHAASGFYRKPAKCFIRFVSMDIVEEFQPLVMEEIKERVDRNLAVQNA